MVISVPDVSSTAYTMSGAVLEVVSASWATASIAKTSDVPCADNVITVNLVPDIDVDTTCVTQLTVAGLTGSTTNSGSTFSTTSALSFSSWDRVNGQLVLNLGKFQPACLVCRLCAQLPLVSSRLTDPGWSRRCEPRLLADNHLRLHSAEPSSGADCPNHHLAVVGALCRHDACWN